MAKAVRMADIAQRLGISIVSVSKALAGKSGVSEEMRIKIEETAREMGYQPLSTRARDAGGESIGVLVADRFFDENTFYSNLYREVLRASARAGVNVLMEIATPESEDSCAAPRFLAEHKVDGLIFMGGISTRYIHAAVQDGIPFVLLDFYADRFPSDCVLSDNISGGYQLTRHLLKTGRRRVAFVGSLGVTASTMDRYLGYTKALLQAGIEPRPEWRIADRGEDGRRIPLVLPEEMPDGFVCCCDEIAFHLVELLQKRGIEVPRDAAVTGYNNFRTAANCRPPLTSYNVDVAAMAQAAVSQLMTSIGRGETSVSTTIVPGTLVVRGSTQNTDGR